MTQIPQKIRKMIDTDPFYKTCALFAQHGHVCNGRITMDHTIIFAGRQLQELWAIVPICAQGHGVDSFQDDATTKKELRTWVSLNRAKIDELSAISKAVSWVRERDRLNDIYGPYVQIVPTPADLVKQATDVSKRSWYLMTEKDLEKIERLRVFNNTIGVKLLPRQVIETAIDDLYLQTANHLSSKEPELYKSLGFDK